jgi:alpha-ribazole phosphatase
MEIYLIRHTTPSVGKGICYGQADISVTESFLSEAEIIQQHLPGSFTSIYSSPLVRCTKLAQHLFADHSIQFLDELMEINCGKWELKVWNEIPKTEIDPWMSDLLNVRIPGGESYTDVFERVTQCFGQIISQQLPEVHDEEVSVNATNLPRVAIVAHGGVIRSILSYITNTPLMDSFKVFSLHYGCVIKILSQNNKLTHEILSNIAHEKETHKPTNI